MQKSNSKKLPIMGYSWNYQIKCIKNLILSKTIPVGKFSQQAFSFGSE
jgi:hypothetical protein